MVGHGGSSAGSYLADPTSPIPSHCASVVVTSTVRVNAEILTHMYCSHLKFPQPVNFSPLNLTSLRSYTV